MHDFRVNRGGFSKRKWVIWGLNGEIPRENTRFSKKWGIFSEKMQDFVVKRGIFQEKTLDFGVKRGILEEKMHDFKSNGVFFK